jgi:hypothetical protein
MSGLLITNKRPQELIGGSTTPFNILVSNGDWTDNLPEHEHQKRYDIDETYTCLFQNNGNDGKETVIMFMLKNNMISRENARWLYEVGYFKNGFINFDDRIPAMFGDIQIGSGAYIWKALDACAKYNLPEGFLKDNPKNINEFLDKERFTKEAEELNNEFNKRLNFKWWWVECNGDGSYDDEILKEARKSSPLGATVVYADGSGCLDPAGQHNHGILNYKDGECLPIDDSYNQRFKEYKKSHLRNFTGWTLIDLKNMEKLKVENNKLYLLVEGSEQKLAMGLDGRLVVYSDKIDTLINSASRSKQYQVPTPITLEQWNSVDKVNGKGELI